MAWMYGEELVFDMVIWVIHREPSNTTMRSELIGPVRWGIRAWLQSHVQEKTTFFRATPLYVQRRPSFLP